MLTASSDRCGLSYQRIVETISDVSPIENKTAVPTKQPSLKRQREIDSESDDEPRHFRRVRMRCHQRARKQGCQSKAEYKAPSEYEMGTIRCVCGAHDNLGLLEDDSEDAQPVRMANTWLIQCVNCKFWQHRSCVGAANGNDPCGGYYYCSSCPLPFSGNDMLTIKKWEAYSVQRLHEIRRKGLENRKGVTQGGG